MHHSCSRTWLLKDLTHRLEALTQRHELVLMRAAMGTELA